MKQLKSFALFLILFVGCNVFAVKLAAQSKIYSSVYEATDNETLAQDPHLDQVWKPGIKYVISIPDNPSMRVCCKLLGRLDKRDKYTPQNTIIFCTNGNKENVEEIAPGFRQSISGSLVPNDQKHTITYYTIEKKKNGKYDYVLKKIE